MQVRVSLICTGSSGGHLKHIPKSNAIPGFTSLWAKTTTLGPTDQIILGKFDDNFNKNKYAIIDISCWLNIVNLQYQQPSSTRIVIIIVICR